MIIECRHCGQRLEVDSPKDIEGVDCPSCQNPLEISRTATQPSSKKKVLIYGGGGCLLVFLLFLGSCIGLAVMSSIETSKKMKKQKRFYLEKLKNQKLIINF